MKTIHEIEWKHEDIVPVVPDLLEAYYHDKSYLIRDERDERYVTVSESSIRRRLQALGVRNKKADDELITEENEIINMIQDRYCLDYAGPIGGWDVGFYREADRNILVTDGPKLIAPDPKVQWPLIKAYLNKMLGDQRDYVLAWIKFGYENVRDKTQRGAPALVLAGPPDCGKTFLHENIVAPILGSRTGDAFLYLTGETNFNKNLIGATMLVCDDREASVDIRSRSKLGAFIKNIVGNSTQSAHAKNKDAFEVHPLWRLVICCNEEPEAMMILPPMVEGMKDKVSLIRCDKDSMPRDTTTTEDFKALSRDIAAELPGFLAFLEAWEIPKHILGGRFGLQAYQHPELLEALDGLSPERRLLESIDAVFTETEKGQDYVFKGPASKLEQYLRDYGDFAVDKLFKWGGACAAYLGRLSKKFPERVEQLPRSNTSRGDWVIYPVVQPKR